MIKNERQYNATKKQEDLLEGALATLLDQPAPNDIDDELFRELQVNALRGQLADLRAEIQEYEDLKSGKVTTLDLTSLEALSHGLIAARIASGMTQKDLAELLGIKEQMIQRYEASDYASASFTRMKDVAHALNLSIREEILLPSAGASIPRLFQRLQEAGIDQGLVAKRILPLSLLAEIEAPAEARGGTNADLAVRAASSVGQVFGFTSSDIFGPGPLELQREAAATARLKVAVTANEPRLVAYAIYANYLARLVLQATAGSELRPIPTNAAECRQAILHAYGEVRFDTVLRLVWDLGIPVLPLSDPGAFHGALWRMRGRNVIVLKQRTSSSSRWLVDLLHELGHAGQSPEVPEFGVIDETETIRGWKASSIEEEAVWFAIDVALGGQAEDLAHECARRSGGDAKRLKTVVAAVARRADVDVGVLADYMAFRLDLDGSDSWWGTATNLQPQGDDPLGEARSVLWERVDLDSLSRFDQDLLARAFATE